MNESFNPRAFLDRKKGLLSRRLGKFRGTFIASRPEGIYIFSPNVKRVHSTIALAGAGQDFTPVENWFRGQLSDLSRQWSVNVPKAKVEINLLTPIFRPNLDFSRELLNVTLVLTEIAEDPSRDFIAKIDCFGEQVMFAPEGIHYIHNHPNEEREDAGTDTEAETYSDDAEEDGGRAEKSLKKELERLRIDFSLWESVSRNDANASEEFLIALTGKYEGKKGFFDRAQLRQRNYNWIFKAT